MIKLILSRLVAGHVCTCLTQTQHGHDKQDSRQTDGERSFSHANSPGTETTREARLRQELKQGLADRARLEDRLVRAEMRALGAEVVGKTQHDAEAHEVVEDLCQQLLHERLQRLLCLEVVRDLSASLSPWEGGRAGQTEVLDAALGRARRMLQEACDEWEAALGGGAEGKGEHDATAGQAAGDRVAGERWREANLSNFGGRLEELVVQEARYVELMAANIS